MITIAVFLLLESESAQKEQEDDAIPNAHDNNLLRKETGGKWVGKE
jgi:hypothetical protein